MHYSKSLLALSGAALLLTGCAGQVVDNSPVVDASVLKVNVHMGGVLLPESTEEQVYYTVADKRAVKSKLEFDSWITNKLMGGGEHSLITRLDKNLIWDVNFDQETYQECPLTGCFSLNPLEQLEKMGEGSSEGEPEEQYDPSGTESCNVSVKKYDFTVTPKARQRDVNGFIANQYIARWDLVTEDDHGKRDEHVVTMDYWMADTKSNQALQASHKFDRKYYDAAIAPTPLARLANENVAEIMKIFSAGKERELAKLTSVGGEPISVKMEWYADVNTCQEPEQKQADNTGFDANDPVGSLQGMATGFLSKKAEDGVKSWMGMEEGKPLLTYIREVKSAKMSGEHTSVFNVPNDFKLIERQ